MALLLVPLAIGILWLPPLAQVGVCALVGVRCLFEWFSMSHPKEPWKPLMHFLGCMILCVLVPVALSYPQWNNSLYLSRLETLGLKWIPIGLLVYGITAWFWKSYKSPLKKLTIAGAVYIVLGVVALLLVMVRGGQQLMIDTLLTIWVTDIGAYFTGKWLKGPRMAPVISPNKTWSGFVGGIFWACLLGLFAYGIPWSDGSSEGMSGMTWLFKSLGVPFVKAPPSYWWILGSFTIALVAHGGDFLESWAKRKFGVKDSGQLIPGHGGLLDRLDSLLSVSLFLGLCFLCIVLYTIIGLLCGFVAK